MDGLSSVNVKCRVVAEFVDDGASATVSSDAFRKTRLAGSLRQEARTRIVGSFVDESAEVRPAGEKDQVPNPEIKAG